MTGMSVGVSLFYSFAVAPSANHAILLHPTDIYVPLPNSTWAAAIPLSRNSILPDSRWLSSALAVSSLGNIVAMTGLIAPLLSLAWIKTGIKDRMRRMWY